MTNRQMQWASEHDWFHYTYTDNGSWVVVVRDLLESNETPEFSDYCALRVWAGY